LTEVETVGDLIEASEHSVARAASFHTVAAPHPRALPSVTAPDQTGPWWKRATGM
jgi:hypothetical protein